ncbi:hypothetical protein EDC02_3509 [Micromonospora sp. Llam0]|uniref:hypothetical protein n=1 Tax=Micromonospora sp. Llam0 TaxID=2485143 RepID=UPI000F8FF22E|nr:hypothetical protein [Micromonospora sp. Llam0]ROO61569.1 hypothetical protein EDC02_3509 [Micromonospora sp. Llam0]
MNDDDTTFDPALVHRLSRPARRPGLIDLGQARSALTRHHTMPAGLPLAEVASRYVDLATQQRAGPTTPIVYARPAPPPPAGHAAPAGALPTSPAAAPASAGPPAPAHPGPVASARRPAADPAGGSPTAASGPVVPARPARPVAELSPVWAATGPGVAGRSTQPVTPRPAAGRPLTIQRKVAAPAEPGSAPSPARPAEAPTSAGTSATRPAVPTGAPVAAGPLTPTAAAPTAAGPADWAGLIGDPGRMASGPHLVFRTPPTADQAGWPAAGVPSTVGQRSPAATPSQVVTARPRAARPAPQLPLAAPSAAGVPQHPAGAGPMRAASGGPGHGATGHGATGHGATFLGGRGFGSRDGAGPLPGGFGTAPARADRGVPQPPAQPAPQVDVGQVTEQVHGRIMRQLAVEAERRGVRR